MIELLIATTNRGKTREIEKILGSDLPGSRIYSLADFSIAINCPENGRTFLENATTKSFFYSRLAAVKDILTAADDSGLVVEVLQGEPGIHSARYAGEECNDDNNIAKLLEKMSGAVNRRAKFVTEIVLSRNGEKIAAFRGEVEGIILHERRGKHGFGYDPVFYYPPLERTFAQLTTDEKNAVSHRAAAFRQLRDYLLKELT